VSHDLLQLPSGPAEATRRRRWWKGAGLRIAVCLAVIVLALAWVAVRGLTGNFVYYLTPTDIVAHHKVPQLFKAGQGVVLEGALGQDGRFHADTVLVQHNGNYFPPKPGQPPPHRADLKPGG
jgi:cytochrome c-type biogenesis protein CcmE